MWLVPLWQTDTKHVKIVMARQPKLYLFLPSDEILLNLLKCINIQNLIQKYFIRECYTTIKCILQQNTCKLINLLFEY